MHYYYYLGFAVSTFLTMLLCIILHDWRSGGVEEWRSGGVEDGAGRHSRDYVLLKAKVSRSVRVVSH